MIGQEPYSDVFGHLKKVEVFSVGLLAALLLLVVSFAVSAGFAANATYSWVVALRAFCVGVATILAAGSTGGLLGFLFGIPRLLQRPAPAQLQSNADSQAADGAKNSAQTSAPERFLSTNTSLEEISDWLTKIIIGLGLVQFQTIIDYVRTSALYAASYVNLAQVSAADSKAYTLTDGTIAIAITFCLIVSSLLLACLVTYLETRTRLAALFTRMELASEKPFVDALMRPISGQTDGNNRDPIKTLATPADHVLAATPLSGLRTMLELAAWGSAQARTGNLPQAVTALQLATEQDPKNSDLKVRLAQAKRLNHDNVGYINAVLDAAKADPTNINVANEARAAMRGALYLQAPNGFELAKQLAQYLMESPLSRDPVVWVYRAAASGQEYKYRRYENKEEAADLEKIKADALKAAERVVELERNSNGAARVYLRNMYVPNSGPDDDLVVFYGDKDFDRVILGDVQPAPQTAPSPPRSTEPPTSPAP
ncbi:hypothetical protein LB526_01925 [Mesorhizobium sp. CA6]|uniref:hypothetical protein n=1 Tax=Mesorhizobium sp. CA6 TaxID=588500 RepID=UPI001CCE39EB|nr:hypothetical protein [Mesorhizobium sp. CA6]MBZ9765518.1 hypothetical protein [Mesorhizobium sp. CA6]